MLDGAMGTMIQSQGFDVAAFGARFTGVGKRPAQ